MPHARETRDDTTRAHEQQRLCLIELAGFECVEGGETNYCGVPLLTLLGLQQVFDVLRSVSHLFKVHATNESEDQCDDCRCDAYEELHDLTMIRRKFVTHRELFVV
jgi:hypothetical protein